MFGDGSDGALNVTSGTTNLLLNTKYQYTTVNVSAGATLSTNSTTGSVLYILATTSITINGAINVSNKVVPGNNAWPVTIDGVTYNSPGVAKAGFSGKAGDTTGFGAGGDTSAGYSGTIATGGASGTPGGTGGSGAPQSTAYTNQTTKNKGGDGGISAGAGGGSYAKFERVSGTITGYAFSGTSGKGGNSYGENGQDGGAGNLYVEGYGSYSYFWVSGGGGGAGGIAGKAGVHVVLKAPQIIINGNIVTSGTNGGKGGDGGFNRWPAPNGLTNRMEGGSGGGGGNAGNVSVFYSESLSGTPTNTLVGGVGGAFGLGLSSSHGQGYNGINGTYSTTAVKPIANFTASPTSGIRPLVVNFNNTSVAATSYLWTFGDGTTSTATNPTKTYSSVGTYTVKLTATSGADSDDEIKTNYITTTIQTFTRSISGTILFGGNANRRIIAIREAKGTLVFGGGARAIIIRDAESIQDKRYLYKVYDEEGNYIETWSDVASELTYTHEINTIGSTTMVELARNSDTKGQTTTPLLTEDGINLLTEDNFDILATTETNNQIGSGTSVDYNNRVDIMVFYGSVEPLYTENDMVITTEDDEDLLADIGAPNGNRIFTGFISEINSRYGSTETTLVQLTSYGWDLGQYPLTNSSDQTTVVFNSQDPSTIAQTAIDKFVTDSAPYDTYTHRDAGSIATTGTTVSYTFRSNTYEDVVNKVLELMPSNWYYRVGLGDNILYYAERSAEPKHLFYLGKHIAALDLKGSILDVTNRVLFTGGGEPALYVETNQAPAPNTRRSLAVMSDNRVTLQASAEIISEGKIEEGNKIQYRTTVEILSGQYDIESVQPGDSVGWRNFDSQIISSLVMYVIGVSYSPEKIQIQLDSKPPTINKRLADLQRNLITSDNESLPVAPV